MFSGTGVARREFEDVGLVSRGSCIGVANVSIVLRSTQIVSTLDIVSPAVGTNLGACPDGVMGENLVGGRCLEISCAVKDSLDDNVGVGCDSEPVAIPILVGFSKRGIAGDDASDMRAVTVLVGRVGQFAVIKKCIDPPRQIGMHGFGCAGMQTGVSDRNRHACAVKSKLMSNRAGASAVVVSGHDFGGDFVEEPWLGGVFNPEDGLRICQAIQLVGSDSALKDPPEARGNVLFHAEKRSLGQPEVLR